MTGAAASSAGSMPGAAASSADAMTSAVASSAVAMDTQAPVLDGWHATDINTQVLERYSAGKLRELGVGILELDVFELHKETWLRDRPALVFISNLCPPTDHKQYLDYLLEQYAWKCSAGDRRAFYEVMAFEAVCGALPSATVVCVTRESDHMRTGKTPVVTAPMGHVPGYVPKCCNQNPWDPLQPIAGGDKNRVRVRFHGPLVPGEFLNRDGSMNLVAMAGAATQIGMPVLFLAEWDGTLSLGIATAVVYEMAVQERTISYRFQVVPEGPRRWLGGRSGTYEAFYAHARQRRALQLMAEQMQVPNPVWPQWECRRALNPHVNLNAACIWHFAMPVTDAEADDDVAVSVGGACYGAGPVIP